MNLISAQQDFEKINRRRAEAAKATLRTYARHYGELDGQEGLGVLARQNTIDLLSDIAHFCDQQGIPLLECIRMAELHYLEETDLKGRRFSKAVRSDSTA